ncbi:MAG: hypothetical protein H6Q31_2601 [Bacteroidetes bacterium]|jgi:hypothetical protein|nr:hypothetical protein [Bacteroidota bacterium]
MLHIQMQAKCCRSLRPLIPASLFGCLRIVLNAGVPTFKALRTVQAEQTATSGDYSSQPMNLDLGGRDRRTRSGSPRSIWRIYYCERAGDGEESTMWESIHLNGGLASLVRFYNRGRMAVTVHDPSGFERTMRCLVVLTGSDNQ